MARPTYPSDKQAQFMLRLPDGMRDRLKLAAESNSRSMNAEVITRIEQSFEEPITVRLPKVLEQRRLEAKEETRTAFNEKLNGVAAGLAEEFFYKPADLIPELIIPFMAIVRDFSQDDKVRYIDTVKEMLLNFLERNPSQGNLIDNDTLSYNMDRLKESED